MTEKVSSRVQSQPDSFEQRLAEAIDLHNEGVKGSRDAVRQADRVLAKLRLDYPGQPIANAFHGSVMSLLARDESNPITRIQWAKRGLKLLDGAVASDPSDSRIRMLRGNVANRLPEPVFHRTETVIEDYLVLIDGELRNPGSVAPKTYHKLIYELGDAYYRVDRQHEAQMCWSYLLKHTDDPEYRRRIEKKLREGNDETERGL